MSDEWRLEVQGLLSDQLFAELQELSLSDTSFNTLEGLDRAIALESLDVSYTHVCDLAPLENHPHLRCLDLTNSKVEDLSPIAETTSLEELILLGARLFGCKSIEEA